MRLMAARATVLHYTNRGKVPVEMEEAWATVLEIATERDEIQYSLRALWGLWAFGTNARPYPQILTLAERFCALAKRSSDPVDPATGDRMLGVTLHYLGDQSGAQSHLEGSLARLGGTGAGTQPVHFQYNQVLAARAYLPRVLWLRGMPDAAHVVFDELRVELCVGQSLDLAGTAAASTERSVATSNAWGASGLCCKVIVLPISSPGCRSN